ncbi:MAG TPA: hypothetical protein DCY28_07715 [Gammaproteobacteria bacterium]|jgi:hypothetical protein|nr:hypothetical protein [Gammaproteobacteria bacterium]
MLRTLIWIAGLISMPVFGQGYEAKYDMIWSVGLKLEAEATETLRKTGDRFEMTLDATASIGSATETTNLLYQPESGWKPLDYSYTQSILGRTTGRNFRFNWNKGSVTWLHEPERAEQIIPIETFDPLGFRLQLAYLLNNGRTLPTSITMLDGNGIKVRSVVPGGLERVDTPYGTIEAQKFHLVDDNADPKRSFEFWLAPSLDYQLVKLEKRDKKRLLALTLKAFSKAGKP